MTELKPCPFCNERLTFRSSRHGDDFYQHSRSNCVLSGGSLGDPVKVWADDESIAAWNRRAVQGQAAESYRQANPLGGPAKVFDAIAEAIRAGDPVDHAMREFGVCWQAAPEARMLTEAEVESTLDEAKVPEYPNCDDIDQQIAAVIQRKFCSVNGISLSGAQAGSKAGRLG